MQRALVCGAGEFIGGHLVKKLKREGYWVRGVDSNSLAIILSQEREVALLGCSE